MGKTLFFETPSRVVFLPFWAFSALLVATDGFPWFFCAYLALGWFILVPKMAQYGNLSENFQVFSEDFQCKADLDRQGPPLPTWSLARSLLDNLTVSRLSYQSFYCFLTVVLFDF